MPAYRQVPPPLVAAHVAVMCLHPRTVASSLAPQAVAAAATAATPTHRRSSDCYRGRLQECMERAMPRVLRDGLGISLLGAVCLVMVQDL